MAAISSPLLESSIDGAKGVVFNITGGHDLTLHEVNSAAEIIYEAVDPNANIIFGAVLDERLQGEVRITVIATGFSSQPEPPPVQTTTRVSTLKRSPSIPTSPTPSPAVPPTAEPRPTKPSLDIPDFLQRRRPQPPR